MENVCIFWLSSSRLGSKWFSEIGIKLYLWIVHTNHDNTEQIRAKNSRYNELQTNLSIKSKNRIPLFYAWNLTMIHVIMLIMSLRGWSKQFYSIGKSTRNKLWSTCAEAVKRNVMILQNIWWQYTNFQKEL